MARARVTILRSIILDLNFLDLRKKEIRIELTHPDVIYFNRGPVSKAPFHSCLAISITEAITKCRLGGRFSPSIVIFIVFVHGFRASVPSSVSRNSFHSVSTRYFCNATEILRDAGISAQTEQGGPSRHVEIIDKSTIESRILPEERKIS